MSSVAVPIELTPEKTEFERLSLDQVDGMHALRGIAVWHIQRGSRRFPSRRDLDFRDIASILPYMSLVMVINGGEDFENRFVGDVVVRAHDVPIRHRRFSEVAADMPRLMDGIAPMFREVVDTGEPLAYRGRTGHDMTHVVYTGFEGVLLPLGETDEAVDHVVYVGACTVDALPLVRR